MDDFNCLSWHCFPWIFGFLKRLNLREAYNCTYTCNKPIIWVMWSIRAVQDLGFDLLPELGQQNEWMSELIFSSMLTSFLVWTFSPFWQESGKRFYTAVLYARVLMVLVSKHQSFSISSWKFQSSPALLFWLWRGLRSSRDNFLASYASRKHDLSWGNWKQQNFHDFLGSYFFYTSAFDF